MSEREKLTQELCDLQCDLSSSNSPIGDWKVVKSYEYALLGEEPPYDVDELHAKRQAVRDRINEIQAILDNMPE